VRPFSISTGVREGQNRRMIAGSVTARRGRWPPLGMVKVVNGQGKHGRIGRALGGSPARRKKEFKVFKKRVEAGDETSNPTDTVCFRSIGGSGRATQGQPG